MFIEELDIYIYFFNATTKNANVAMKSLIPLAS